MRGAKASYDKALWLLARAKELADYPVLTKSGIIVGLGETNDEVVETLRDLRAHGVDVVTIGQYLQPSAEARDDRPLGAPGRVPLVPRAGRGARLRLGLLRAARALELPRRRAAARRRDGPRRGRVLAPRSRPWRWSRRHAARPRARPIRAASKKPGHPQLAPTDQSPLTVKGTGFRPHEHVLLAAKGLKSSRAETTADSSGSFIASFKGLKSCDSITVSATGSKGSRTEFNLSQIVCTDA